MFGGNDRDEADTDGLMEDGNISKLYVQRFFQIIMSIIMGK